MFMQADRPWIVCSALWGRKQWNSGVNIFNSCWQFILLTFYLVANLSCWQKVLVIIHNSNPRHSHHGPNPPYHPYLTVCKSYHINDEGGNLNKNLYNRNSRTSVLDASILSCWQWLFMLSVHHTWYNLKVGRQLVNWNGEDLKSRFPILRFQ